MLVGDTEMTYGNSLMGYFSADALFGHSGQYAAYNRLDAQLLGFSLFAF